MDVPKNILGMIEFEPSYIPVVDLSTAFGTKPINIDHSKCILIVEHEYKSLKLYTGIIIQDFEEIEKLAAGIFKPGIRFGASTNMNYVLKMCNNHNDEHEILVESHRILSLLKESETEIDREYSNLQFGRSYNFMNDLGAMDLPQRQLSFKELANRPELWSKEGDLMFL